MVEMECTQNRCIATQMLVFLATNDGISCQFSEGTDRDCLRADFAADKGPCSLM